MLELRRIYKSYQGKPLLRGLSFRVRAHEIACLIGPSGSGKSTLLQIIAGLEFPEKGYVLWNGKNLGSVPVHLRNFGLVFQDYALFPHLNVYDNVAFGLRMKRWTRLDERSRVEEVIRLVDLEGLEHRATTDLSGGEQQRVALARALAPRPRLLMFDEPLGALDRALREELLDQLRTLLRRARIPCLYVTHDQEEAFRIADRILLLHDGRIVRDDLPVRVWEQPGSAWVADFLNLGNILSGRVLAGAKRIETPHGTFDLDCTHRHQAGDAVRLLARAASGQRAVLLKGVVRDAVSRQDKYLVRFTNGLQFELSNTPKIGQRLSVRVRLECLGSALDS